MTRPTDTSTSIRRLLGVALAIALSVVSACPAGAEICNIRDFLEECPTGDPAITQILNDFTIRKNGVAVGTIQCQGPISQLTTTQYTDELIVLQALRTVYHLDRGRSGHVPWTSGTLYDWLKARISGINITTTGGDSCCSSNYGDGRTYFNVRANDDVNKNWKRTWIGISEFIGLMMHERRHLDGTGFPHVGCCSVGANACDQHYDEANLSPYGIQWWLRRQWIEGGLYTGYACLGAQEIGEIKTFLRNMNNSERQRYCQNPPVLLTDANNPVGSCQFLCGGRIDIRPWWPRPIPPWIPIVIFCTGVAAWLIFRRPR